MCPRAYAANVRFVLGPVFDKEFICCLLDRFPPLFAGFLFKDLAVALL